MKYLFSKTSEPIAIGWRYMVPPALGGAVFEIRDNSTEYALLTWHNWAAIILLAVMLILVLLELVSTDGDYAMYLRLVNKTGLFSPTSVNALDSFAIACAASMQNILRTQGEEVEIDREAAAELTKYLKALPADPHIDGFPFALAGAFYGKIIVSVLGGEMKLKKVGKYYDLVVMIGYDGLTKREFSPGFWAFTVWKCPECTIEEHLENEINEWT